MGKHVSVAYMFHAQLRYSGVRGCGERTELCRSSPAGQLLVPHGHSGSANISRLLRHPPPNLFTGNRFMYDLDAELRSGLDDLEQEGNGSLHGRTLNIWHIVNLGRERMNER